MAPASNITIVGSPRQTTGMNIARDPGECPGSRAKLKVVSPSVRVDPVMISMSLLARGRSELWAGKVASQSGLPIATFAS